MMLLLDSFDAVAPQLGRVFKDIGPISDADLCAAGFAVESSANEDLHALRGLRRLELAARRQWIDFGFLRRISPYGAWFFAPSVMLMAHRNLEQYEFVELMQLFTFDDKTVVASSLQRLLVQASLSSCLDGRPSADMDVDWFSRYASFFSPVEKKAVSLFLQWLQLQWPDDSTVVSALEMFWSK